MSFIVPALESHLYGRFNFGACLTGGHIADPGGMPGRGVVHLRGAVSPDPMYTPSPIPPAGLIRLFTLPAGMRPAADRWFACVVSTYLGMYDMQQTLCVIRSSGEFEVLKTGGVDGAVFVNGLSFIAEQ